MFTGVIEAIGRVEHIDFDSPTESLIIRAPEILADAHDGDSVAVNGACLTITRFDAETLAVGVMPETLRRTSLGQLQIGADVNLERPVLATTRMGGHFVQGHVDGTGTVASVEPDGVALTIRIAAPPDVLRYIVEKGFVAVEGASLTVTQVDSSGFSLALIPYSQEHLASGIRTAGSKVNLEVDVLAKYVEKLVVHWPRSTLCR